MNLSIVPLKALAFQVLILLLTIAVESLVFHFKLKIHRKTCVEYAAFINLLSTCFGWLIFFAAVTILPQSLENQLMNYLVFGEAPAMERWLKLAIFLSFIFSLIVKLTGLRLCKFLWYKDLPKPNPKKPSSIPEFKNRQSIIVFLGHTCSHLAIAILFLIQNN